MGSARAAREIEVIMKLNDADGAAPSESEGTPVEARALPAAAADGVEGGSGGDSGCDGGSPTAISPKKARKLLKDGERRLRRELQRYRDTVRKARHDLGAHSVTADREKVKKAEWMFSSIKHYQKEFDKKSAEIAPRLPVSFHNSVEQSISDLKSARKRLKHLRKEQDAAGDAAS